MHPDELTPDQRRNEIAAILARGFLRMHFYLKDSAVNRDVTLDVNGEQSVYAPTKHSTP